MEPTMEPSGAAAATHSPGFALQRSAPNPKGSGHATKLVTRPSFANVHFDPDHASALAVEQGKP